MYILSTMYVTFAYMHLLQYIYYMLLLNYHNIKHCRLMMPNLFQITSHHSQHGCPQGDRGHGHHARRDLQRDGHEVPSDPTCKLICATL